MEKISINSCARIYLLESLNSPYVLKKYEDDIVVNPTLAYMFSRDYGIELPSFDPDEDTLESFMEKIGVIGR